MSGGVATPAGVRENKKTESRGPRAPARIGFCLESWVPEVFGPPASSRMVFERRQPRTLPVINPFLLQNRLSRVLFSSTGGPGPAGSGQRTLHPRVFVFCFGGPGPQSQRADPRPRITCPASPAPCTTSATRRTWMSWSTSPSNLPADFNVSLVSVQSNWTTSEVNAYHRLRFTDRALCAASSHPDPAG